MLPRPARSAFLLPLLAALVVIAGFIVLGKLGIGPAKPLVTVDGTYQTFGMLERTGHGDMPGRGHIPYLGIGLCYALAPLFALFGSSVFAAWAAAQAGTQLAWLACLWCFARACGASPQQAAGRAGLVFLVTLVARLAKRLLLPHATDEMLSAVFEPGNSLLYLRDSAPIILATLVLAAPRRWQGGILAVGAGALVWWSPASGLALALTAAAVRLGMELQPRKPVRRRLAALTGWGILLLLAMLAMAALIAGGDPLVLIRRVFLDPGGNQFWFFGGFADHARVLRLADLARVVGGNWLNGLTLALALAAGLLGWRRARTGGGRPALVMLILGSQFLAGLISQVGGHIEAHYFSSVANSGIGLAVLLAWPARLPFVRPGRSFRAGRAVLAVAAAGMVAVSALVLHPTAAIQRKFASGLGHYLPEAAMPFPAAADGELAWLRAQRRVMDLARVPADRRLLATYHAWPDLIVGATAHPRFNSIIHLMNAADRAEFAAYLLRQQPVLAATVDPAASGWEYWNVRASWQFYRALIAQYHPVRAGTAFDYWERGAAAAPTAPAPRCIVEPHGPATAVLTFPALPAGSPAMLLDVALDYDADPGRPGPGGALGRGYLRVADRSSVLLARLAAEAAAGRALPAEIHAAPGVWYGLPSGQHTASLPVEHGPGAPSRLVLETQGGGTARLTIRACRVTAMLPDPLTTLGQLPRLEHF